MWKLSEIDENETCIFCRSLSYGQDRKPAKRKYGGGKQRKKEKGQDGKTELMSPPKGK